MTGSNSDYIWKDLLQAVYWFDDSLQQYLRAAGWPEQSRTKSLIMLNIAEGYTRPSQIAENLGLSRQGIHLALKELETDGFVEFQADPEDRRAKRVTLAQSGERDEMRQQTRKALLAMEEVLASRLGKRRFDMFRSVLKSDWGDPVVPHDPTEDDNASL